MAELCARCAVMVTTARVLRPEGGALVNFPAPPEWSVGALPIIVRWARLGARWRNLVFMHVHSRFRNMLFFHAIHFSMQFVHYPGCVSDIAFSLVIA